LHLYVLLLLLLLLQPLQLLASQLLLLLLPDQVPGPPLCHVIRQTLVGF
jgi:hypothetical protein